MPNGAKYEFRLSFYDISILRDDRWTKKNPDMFYMTETLVPDEVTARFRPVCHQKMHVHPFYQNRINSYKQRQPITSNGWIRGDPNRKMPRVPLMRIGPMTLLMASDSYQKWQKKPMSYKANV